MPTLHANVDIVTLTNTFDEWRTRTNDIINDRNQLRNAEYVKDENNFIVANGIITIARSTGGTTFINENNAQIGNTLYVLKDVSVNRNVSTQNLATQNLTVAQNATINAHSVIIDPDPAYGIFYNGIGKFKNLTIDAGGLAYSGTITTSNDTLQLREGASTDGSGYFKVKQQTSNAAIKFDNDTDTWKLTSDESSVSYQPILTSINYLLRSSDGTTITTSSGINGGDNDPTVSAQIKWTGLKYHNFLVGQRVRASDINITPYQLYMEGTVTSVSNDGTIGIGVALDYAYDETSLGTGFSLSAITTISCNLCAAGIRGINGYVGSNGAQGNQGFQGAQGIQGIQGLRGFQGFQGFQGAQGIMGYQGSTGVSPGGTSGYLAKFTGTTTIANSIVSESGGVISIAGSLSATGNITAYAASDRRLKQNIIAISNALNKLMQISGVEFDWTDDYIKNNGGEDGYFIRRHDVGVIAQEIEAVLPEIVATRTDGFKAIRYEKLVALLIEAIKEQNNRIDILEQRLNKLEGV